VRVVVDANVLVMANQPAGGPNIDCAAKAAAMLLEAQRRHVLLEDKSDLCLAEYKRYCSFAGQPGAGDRFFAWYIRTRWTPSKIDRIDIGPDEAAATSHLPIGLHALDRSDHKWVAVYLNGSGDALYNAVDSDWREHTAALKTAGVNVVELC